MAGVEAGSLVRTPEVTDQYAVLEKISWRGADNVFRARRRVDDVIVTLKEVRDPTKARLERETGRALLFENIVQLLGSFVLDGGAVLVLEYLHEAQRSGFGETSAMRLVLNSPVLDRYDVLERLKGDRDTLFKARRRRDCRLVVLKEVRAPTQICLEQATGRAVLNNKVVELLDSFVIEDFGAVLVMGYPDDAQPAEGEEVFAMVTNSSILREYDVIKQIEMDPYLFNARRRSDDLLVLLYDIEEPDRAKRELDQFVRGFGEILLDEKKKQVQLLCSFEFAGGAVLVLVYLDEAGRPVPAVR